jgi:hypothetical protein
VSIYSQLLVAAMDSEARADRPADGGQLEADLARCRARLPHGEYAPEPTGGVTGAVADQLAYDLALLALCRHAGVTFDIAEFDRPATARYRLENALCEGGASGGASRRGRG